MNPLPRLADHLVIALVCLVLPLLDWLWLYPRLVRASQAGRTGMRLRAYGTAAATAWGATALMLVVWAGHHRAWAMLGLGLGAPLRLVIGPVLAAVYVRLMWKQMRAVRARPNGREVVRRSLGKVGPLAPRLPAERRGFALLSVTAGITEEVLFRGYVLWYATTWLGPLPGLLVSSVLFGWAHVYLGWVHVFRTSLVGLVLGLVVLATGSLWGAMLIHSLMDLVGGEFGYYAFSGPDPAGDGPAAPLVA